MFSAYLQDELVTQFGSVEWKMGVRIVSSGNTEAVLMGTTEVSFVGGWANFTDLAISHAGDGW